MRTPLSKIFANIELNSGKLQLKNEPSENEKRTDKFISKGIKRIKQNRN